ncbi:MAG: methyltransferase domain-containing protein [Lachnospiraceae bacterium]|nr:methyltransferase domain-containing protein [Lachnospiraceae bacterium]
MDAYQDFAYVYDELMDNTPYEEWCDRIEALIAKYGVSEPVDRTRDSMMEDFAPAELEDLTGEQDEEEMDERESGDEDQLNILDSEKNLVVDLGCGTGTLTELLYQKGYDMIGIDNAEEMLNIAMEKRAESGSQILYLLQDMRELELYSTVGTVVSVCDSVNYILEEEELLETFSLVNNYLYPGGIFIFDFNTEYKYREIIGDSTIAENREDCSFIWENYYDPDSCINEYDLTVFVQEEEDIFRRFTETHYQRGYTTGEMKRLVEQAGMTLLEMKDADTGGEVRAESQRVYIVAREKGKTLQ